LLDRAMKMLDVPRIQSHDSKATHGYYLKETTGKHFSVRNAATT
jgi:hypothetical protein